MEVLFVNDVFSWYSKQLKIYHAKNMVLTWYMWKNVLLVTTPLTIPLPLYSGFTFTLPLRFCWSFCFLSDKNQLLWSIKKHNFSYLALPRILGRWQSPQGGRTGWQGGRVRTSAAWVRWSERRSMRVATPGSQRTNCTANPRGRREGAWRCQQVSSNCTHVSSHWAWPTDKLNISRLQSERILRIKTSDET